MMIFMEAKKRKSFFNGSVRHSKRSRGAIGNQY
jgi:hypothetical protein